MREQLIQYVNLLFAGSPGTYEMQQEILQNTLDRYDDLLSQGKTPEAAYRLAIGGIGDINEVLGSIPVSPDPRPTAERPTTPTPVPAVKNNRKWMQALAIGLYICCVIPVLIFENVGTGMLGVCLMFVMIAAATVLLILSPAEKEEQTEKESDDMPKTKLGRTLKRIWGLVTLGIYLSISFKTGAWHITWLVFPIMGAVNGIIRAAMDLKEAK
ncbi:MAG: hypothetical protein E7438_05550 [Ruminococcaceae bacterium]|nr:hypothetical protein [Oscillospiraceae bacterium]